MQTSQNLHVQSLAIPTLQPRNRENSAWGERVWKVRASSSWLWCRNQGWKQKEDIVVAISNFLQAPAPFLLSLVPNPGNEPSSSKAFLQQQDAHLVRMDCGSDDSWFRRTKHWADIKTPSFLGIVWELWDRFGILVALSALPLGHVLIPCFHARPV